jgi:hypothetical protein
MHFQTISIIFGGLLAQGVIANPVANPDALMVDHEQKVEGGKMVYYTNANTSPVTKRWCLFGCPEEKCQTSIVCDDENGGPQPTCERMVDALYNYPDISLANQPQICFMSDAGEKCCMKWTKTIPNLTQGHLKELGSESE